MCHIVKGNGSIWESSAENTRDQRVCRKDLRNRIVEPLIFA